MSSPSLEASRPSPRYLALVPRRAAESYLINTHKPCPPVGCALAVSPYSPRNTATLPNPSLTYSK